MKKLFGLSFLLALAFPVFACDEACQRDRAEALQGSEFPGYLSWKFCEDTKASFVEGDVRSLEKYRDTRINIQHKRRMKNIQNFVEQRKEWLVECDNYFVATKNGRIFQDDKTTQEIFSAMDDVASELASAINGVTYVAESEETAPTAIIGGKFDSLFKMVDDHKTVMMLKGQFVRN
ncbi:hypothetical protein NBRC116494_14210 [Aurantivibrio plasticivorans]